LVTGIKKANMRAGTRRRNGQTVRQTGNTCCNSSLKYKPVKEWALASAGSQDTGAERVRTVDSQPNIRSKKVWSATPGSEFSYSNLRPSSQDG
jgi:hypothetical protein